MKNLIKDLIKFQQTVPVIPKNSYNPHFKSQFADLATVVDVCKPCLNENNLCMSQRLITLEGRNALNTTLFHDSGEMIEATIFLPDIADAQKLTAAITYLRRTSYLSILGLVADTDDDGNSLLKDERKTPPPQSRPPEQKSNNLASDAQKIAMKKLGISFRDNVSKQEATNLIKEYNNKRGY